MNKTICFVAGKSGGHIVPALTLAQQHKNKHPHDTILFFSTNSFLDTHLAGNHKGVDTYVPLNLENVPYNKLLHYPRFIGHCLQSMIKAFKYLRKHNPSQVISMGGYISIPVCLAARLLRIPVTIMELNAVPGKTTKVLAPFAHNIVVCFRQAQNYFPTKKCRLERYPIRFTAPNTDSPQPFIREKLGLHADRTTIFVLGGSQGSLFINNLVKELIMNHPQLMRTLQFIHQTGTHDTTDWNNLYNEHAIPAIVFTYTNDVENYYRAADVIICRSGAGTLWESLFFNKKTITIPLETSTTDHQVDNARAIAHEYPHLCTMILQKKIIQDKSILVALIENIR